MDWNIIQGFIKPELLILIAVCYCLGLFIKQAPNIKDWLIPFILLGFTIVMSILYLCLIVEKQFSAAIILNGFIYGILCAAVAVFGNQITKQIKKK